MSRDQSVSVAQSVTGDGGRLGRYFFGSLAFAIPFALSAAYALNHFYGVGAFFWDSGFLAYMATFSTSWPMLMPELLHRPSGVASMEYFQVHFHPIFYATTLLHQAVPFLPAGAYFALLQSLIPGLLGLAVYVLCIRSRNLALSLIVALATAFCGPVLAAMGFPHPEPAIPALFLLFLALRTAGLRKCALFCLGLSLLVREDAGLHMGAPLFLLAGVQWLSSTSRQSARENFLIAIMCFAYSAAALAFQHFAFPAPQSSLKRVYLGDPVWAHLSWALISERIVFLFTDRAYLTLPLLLLLALAAWKRNAVLAVGPISVLPWIALSTLQVKDGVPLESYYSFPVIIAIAWPSFALSLGERRLAVQLATSLLSIVLFVALGRSNHDDAPWRGLSFPSVGTIGGYEAELRKTVGRRSEFGRLMVDNAVASLVPEALRVDELTQQWAIDRLPNPDVVIYKAHAWDASTTRSIIEAAGLTHSCRIGNTPFWVASRLGAVCK